MKILFLVQAEQRVNLDPLYQGVCDHADCDLRYLSSDEQADLKQYFQSIDVSRYDRILLFLRFKKEIKQVRFLKTLPNLCLLEHDACQNYLPGKYQGKFSQHYAKLPAARVISSGYTVSQRLREEGIDAVFVSKGYDQNVLRNLNQSRDIELGFLGSVESRVYSGRKEFLEKLAEVERLQIKRTASGDEYLAEMNRIRFFVSCDMGLGEYMIKNFEAMACGCVLLAYDQGVAENDALGFRDMENIVLYASLEELRTKLATLRAQPERADAIAEAGQQLAEDRYRFSEVGKRVAEAMRPELRPADRPRGWLPRLLGSNPAEPVSGNDPLSLRFVIPYFGQWPFWFDFFLTSCGWNPRINWLIYTDCGIPENAPGNVQFVEMDFEKYCQLVSTRLGINFHPERPYKLCDIKAAIGVIHEPDLVGWDYFGFCDLDVIFGDLAPYLEPRIRRYNLVTTHATRVAGHLTVMRNIPEMREAFRKAEKWQAAFEKEENVRFDEKAFSKVFIKHKNWPVWLRRIYDLFDFYRRTSLLEEAYSTPGCSVAWHDGSFDFPEKWFCGPASLTNNQDGKRQFPYLHFLGWKHYNWLNIENPEEQLIHTDMSASGSLWALSVDGFRCPKIDHARCT